MESKNWWESKRIWTQILTISFGVLVLVDQQFGTKILDSQVAGFVISILGLFGFYFTKTANSVIN